LWFVFRQESPRFAQFIRINFEEAPITEVYFKTVCGRKKKNGIEQGLFSSNSERSLLDKYPHTKVWSVGQVGRWGGVCGR